MRFLLPSRSDVAYIISSSKKITESAQTSCTPKKSLSPIAQTSCTSKKSPSPIPTAPTSPTLAHSGRSSSNSCLALLWQFPLFFLAVFLAFWLVLSFAIASLSEAFWRTFSEGFRKRIRLAAGLSLIGAVWLCVLFSPRLTTSSSLDSWLDDFPDVAAMLFNCVDWERVFWQSSNPDELDELELTGIAILFIELFEARLPVCMVCWFSSSVKISFIIICEVSKALYLTLRILIIRVTEILLLSISVPHSLVDKMTADSVASPALFKAFHPWNCLPQAFTE